MRFHLIRLFALRQKSTFPCIGEGLVEVSPAATDYLLAGNIFLKNRYFLKPDGDFGGIYGIMNKKSAKG